MSQRFVYSQSSGLFGIGSTTGIRWLGKGYAGRSVGRNNPRLQGSKGIGPLPRGVYALAEPRKHPRLGPVAFKLKPDPSNAMFGRGDFWIHGDNKENDASSGCIVLQRAIREEIQRLKIRTLVVR